MLVEELSTYGAVQRLQHLGEVALLLEVVLVLLLAHLRGLLDRVLGGLELLLELLRLVLELLVLRLLNLELGLGLRLPGLVALVLGLALREDVLAPVVELLIRLFVRLVLLLQIPEDVLQRFDDLGHRLRRLRRRGVLGRHKAQESHPTRHSPLVEGPARVNRWGPRLSDEACANLR